MPLSSLAGNFNDTQFSDVVNTLRQQKATGTLACTVQGAQKQVHVMNGQIIFAMSQSGGDRLGEIMVKMGKISREQLSRALDLQKRTAGLKKIGAVFVEQGFVEPRDLFNGLKFQVRSIILSLFLTPEGSYQFSDSMPPEVIPLQIDMEDLLKEVIQQMKRGR